MTKPSIWGKHMKDDDLGNMLPNVVRDTNDCVFSVILCWT
jgi:hypothetical protein